ncbi:MAG TPA: hypothetical protein VLM18_04535 [Croceibacterium sp.]|nr:hypothetical protein [Croceibacterium sp.]
MAKAFGAMTATGVDRGGASAQTDPAMVRAQAKPAPSCDPFLMYDNLTFNG